MSLGEFYKQVENTMINNLTNYFMEKKKKKHIRIVNLFMAYDKYIHEKGNVIDMCIGNNPNDFIKDIYTYIDALHGETAHIVNCRFSAREFMMTYNNFDIFISFVSSLLQPDGFFMGFMLDLNKINGIFMKRTSMTAGPYSIEYVSDDNDEVDNFLSKILILNGDISRVITFETMNNMCEKYGLEHVNNILLEKLHMDSLRHIKLNDYEKLFGFLNYVFLFQKGTNYFETEK